MAVHLVCEGGPSGLDNRVLDRLVVQFHNLPVLMAPSGSSRGHGAVRNFLTNRGPDDVVISVEDRDYMCSRREAESSWADPSRDHFRWRRHEIENYLLEPPVVLALFDGYRQAGATWARTLPVTTSDVLTWLQTIAAGWIENHAGEVLKAELLWLATTAGGNLKFGPKPPPKPPGQSATDEAGWVAALQTEATRLCGACAVASRLPELQPAAIAARYQVLRTEFQAGDFLRSGDFLIDMGGHELMAAFLDELWHLGAPRKFSSLTLEEDLLDVLTTIYQPDTLFQPDDFHELAQILRHRGVSQSR